VYTPNPFRDYDLVYEDSVREWTYAPLRIFDVVRGLVRLWMKYAADLPLAFTANIHCSHDLQKEFCGV
jgi:hypothetical protein